jgi:YD repeat-containing protein
MKDIVFWDYQWEMSYPKPNRSACQGNYEALVFCPAGNVQYFYITNGLALYLQDPRSQERLQPSSALGYPTVTNNVSDANGIFWGGSQTNGFNIVYPDGSKEVFGFCIYPSGFRVPNMYQTGYSGAHAFLTQRIDPQGRVTSVGYEYETNTSDYTYRVRYVVDPDGRTNTFKYYSGLQLSEVDDPYGKATFTYDSYGRLFTITDPVTNTSVFSYQGDANGWITNLTTPYGKTGFTYYQLPDTTTRLTNCYQQRAVYVTEPEGAQQLFCYLHKTPFLPSTGISPTNVPGQLSFDDGTSSNEPSGHGALIYRNTFHWG